jgi:hypothetical protein
VRDKLKALHREMDSHVRSRPRYTVGEALDDWLADGLTNVSASTMKLYKDTIANPSGAPGFSEADGADGW